MDATSFIARKRRLVDRPLPLFRLLRQRPQMTLLAELWGLLVGMLVRRNLQVGLARWVEGAFLPLVEEAELPPSSRQGRAEMPMTARASRGACGPDIL